MFSIVYKFQVDIPLLSTIDKSNFWSGMTIVYKDTKYIGVSYLTKKRWLLTWEAPIERPILDFNFYRAKTLRIVSNFDRNQCCRQQG